MYCIYCDAGTPDTATFCPTCGRQFPRALTPPVITCNSCRAGNPNDAVFCWHCGRRLERDRAAGLIVPELLLGGALGAGAAEGISSQLQHPASDVGQALGQGVTNAGQGLGHAATDAGQSLGRAATDAGHGLGHPATNMGQGLGHAPSTMAPVSHPSLPTSTPPASPTQGYPPQPAPSSPSAPPGHPPQPPAPTGHPGTPPTPPQPGSPMPPGHPAPPPPAPHPVPPVHPGSPPVYQPHPVHPGEPEKGDHHKHHRPEHGKHPQRPHTPHPTGSASKLVLGIVPKSLLIIIIGAVVGAGAIFGIVAITSSHGHGTVGVPGGGTQSISGGPGTGGNGGTQSSPNCIPHITSVSSFAAGQTQNVDIQGSCFGVDNTFSNADSSYFKITINRSTPSEWHACYTGDAPADSVTCSVSSWTDNSITFSGFTGTYGAGNWVVNPQDMLTIDVWNPQKGQSPGECTVVAGTVGTTQCSTPTP